MLFREKPEGRFTTYELLVTIKDIAPHFPRKDQIPQLHPRRGRRGKAGRIMLHPIARERSLAEDHSHASSGKAGEILTLHFSYGRDITKNDLLELGELLNESFSLHNIRISGIAYGGVEPTFLELAAAGFMRKIYKRRHSGSKYAVLPPISQPDPRANDTLKWLKSLSAEDNFHEHPQEAMMGSPGYHFRMLLYSIYVSSKECDLPFPSSIIWTEAWMIIVIVMLVVLISH